MSWRLFRVILVLPGTVTVLVPGLLVLATQGTRVAVAPAGPWDPAFWGALPALGLGLILGVTTVRLFVRHGEGTPAPWDPPKRLVVRGPYRHVRNPMIVGVLFILLAESLVLQSPPVAGWMALFFLANAAYFPLSEEPALERRFGEDYRRYKANVPRWIPRWRAWEQTATGESSEAGKTGEPCDRE
jgi:protein-S-isoprenylcysteine O-methyltransferase Ste14